MHLLQRSVTHNRQAIVRRLDVKPVVDRTATNGISKAEAVRDLIYDLFLRSCQDEGVEGLVLKSYPFSTTIRVRFECWIRHP